MNETVASDDDDGEPFVFTETFVAAVVGVCGVLVFCLPLNKLIRWCCLAAGGPNPVLRLTDHDGQPLFDAVVESCVEGYVYSNSKLGRIFFLHSNLCLTFL